VKRYVVRLRAEERERLEALSFRCRTRHLMCRKKLTPRIISIIPRVTQITENLLGRIGRFEPNIVVCSPG